MRSYHRAAHAVYECHSHFVFITKYRKPVLKGEIARAIEFMIRQHANEYVFVLALHQTNIALPLQAAPRYAPGIPRRRRAP